jgi:hypothetical protein
MMKTITLNNPSGSKMNLKLSSFFATLCLLFISSVFYQAKAQNPPACSQNCSAKDIKVKSIELVTFNGDPTNDAQIKDPAYYSPLPATCNQGETITGYLKVNLNVTASTRYTFLIAGQLWVDNVHITAKDPNQCFPNTLNKGDHSIIISTDPIVWTCGSKIEIREAFTAWGNSAGDNVCSFSCTQISSHCKKYGINETFTVITSLSANFTWTAACVGGTYERITFDASSSSGGVTPYKSYAWDFDNDGTFDRTTTTATTTYDFTSAGTHTVRVRVTAANDATNDFFDDVEVASCCTASVVPTGASATTATICNGGNTNISVSGGSLGTGATWKWYADDCGSGTSIGSGSTVNVSPTSTTTYYVRAEGNCGTTACASVTVTVNQKSADPTSATASSATICNGQSSTLTLNGGGGGTDEVIKWYTSSCGGTEVGTGNNLSVSPITTTTYYGRYENGAPCNYNSACASVTVTVNQPIEVTNWSGNSIVATYGDASAAFSVTASNVVSYQWQKTTPSGTTFSNILGETNSTISISNPTVAMHNTQHKVLMSANSPCPNVSRTGTLTVNPAKACGTYNGEYFKNTTSSTGGSATINLSVELTKDPTGAAGDIKTATIKFIITPQNGGGGSTEVLGTLASSSTSDVATFTGSFTANLSTLLSQTYVVRWEIGGNYVNNSTCDDNTMITVSAPANDFVTGGGFNLQNNTGGIKGGTPNQGLKSNFGFNIKWNKSLTNLQGNWNNIIRRIENGNVVSYQVKSSQPKSLIVTKLSTGYRTDFTFTGVNLKSLTSDWSEGNATVNVIVYDNGEPGKGVDQIWIQVRDKNNNVWYVTDVNTNPVNVRVNDPSVPRLTQGNIQVHTAGGIKTSAFTVSTQTTGSDIAKIETPVSKLDVTASPNPFTDRIRFTIRAPKAGRATLEVYNMLGQKVGVPFEGMLNANETRTVDFNAPANHRSNLIYTLRMNGEQISGKLMSIKQ